MKQKAKAAGKSTPAKPKKNQNDNTATKRVLQLTASVPARRSPVEEAAFSQTVHAYQEGLRLLQERKFERAKGLLQKVVQSAPHDLAERAKVHLNTCLQRLEQTATNFRTHEEHYDYAVSLINTGQHAQAREHLEKILKLAPKADFAWYGMAVLDCLTERYEESLRELTEAIELNPTNRFQARNDSDFNNMADDPRFTELLYPENETPVVSPG